MCIKINGNILCHFLWNDLTNNQARSQDRFGGGVRDPQNVDLLDPKSGLFFNLTPLTLLQKSHFWPTLWLKVDLLADLRGASHPPATGLQTTFFWKCVTSSKRPACNLLAYTGYLNLYFYMRLEWSMICSWTSMCPPLTDPYKQTNKILNSSISAKDSFKSILNYHECNIGPTLIACTRLQSICLVCLALQRQSFEMCFPLVDIFQSLGPLWVFCSKLVEFLKKHNWN